MTPSALQDLLAAIIANPHDDGARLVYADALTSDGDPRGEFIVVQVALAKLGVATVNDIAESDTLSDADVVRAGALLRRQNELLEEHALTWIDAELGDIDFYERVRFQRGFVSRVKLEKEDDARCLRQFFESARAPGVEALYFVKRAAQDDGLIDAVVGQTTPLAHVGLLASLRELFIDAPAQSTLSGAAVERLIRVCPKLETIVQKHCPFPLAPHLEAACTSTLTSLNVEGLTPEMVMRAPCMRHVKVLNLSAYGEHGPDFLDASVCPNLEEVTMQRRGYHPGRHWVDSSIPLTFTSDAFKNREPLPALTTLRFKDNSRSSGNAIGELLDSKIGSTLKEIEVDGIGITHEAVEAIVASPSIRRVNFGHCVKIRSLATLALRERGPGFQEVCIDSVAKKVDAPILEAFLAKHSSLRILNLGGRGGLHPIFEGKLVDVLATHAPASLRSLTLYNWDLTDDDRVSALVRSPSLANLRRLCLHDCAIGDGGARSVSEAPMPNLVEINLNANGVRGRGIRAFFDATQKFPGLAALCLGGSGDGDSYTLVSRAIGPVFPYKASYTMASGEPMSSSRDAKLEIVLPYGSTAKHLIPKEIAMHLKEEAVRDLFSDVKLSPTETEVDAKLNPPGLSVDEGSPSIIIKGVVPPFTLEIKCASSGGTYTITIWYRLSDRHAIRPALERITKHLMSITGQGTEVHDHVVSCEGGIGEE